ncbi:low molecular weight protein-tyrosine-phosphatase [Gorillibacterium sp. sgz5001074]|uniref:low molecular weight protein-tyrosine-phosphatase n=1 Tax=Gorillibacterium sp. sgz5001074 TaxID=3446695 RepID=UPI003F671B77
MIQVLFVCLGNICRSPMAEAVFRHKVKMAGLEDRIRTDSAGTGDWHTGQPPHEGTRKVLRSNGISYEGIAARQVKAEDLKLHRYVVAMDASNVSNLARVTSPGPDTQVVRLMDFVPNSGTPDVPDPYYTGNFDEVYGMVDAGCQSLLEHIIREEKLY